MPSAFLMGFITHMLGNRIFRSNAGGCFIVRRANVGLKCLESRDIKVVAYADDIVILVCGKFLSTLDALM